MNTKDMDSRLRGNAGLNPMGEMGTNPMGLCGFEFIEFAAPESFD